MRVIAALAWAGLRHHPLRWVLLALGVAVGAVLPVVAGGLRETAAVAAVRAAIDGLPAGQQAVFAYDGKTEDSTTAAALDQKLRTEWGGVGLPDPTRYLFFRPLSVAGSSFTLGATDAALDAAGSPIRLTSGRVPVGCTPTRCEVVLVVPVGSDGVSIASVTPAANQLGLVVTGTAALLDDRLTGGGLLDGANPVLLGGSVARMAQLDTLSLFGRNVGWVGALPADLVAGTGADQFAAGMQTMTERLTTDFGALTIAWPQQVATNAAARADSSAQRFTVLGAGAAVLQLGFSLVAATGLRRRQQFVQRLLTRRGATRAQLALTPAVQVLAVVLVGVGVGLGIGALVVGVTAGGLPAGRGTVVRDALVSAWPTLLGFAVGAAAVTLAVAVWPERAGRSTRLILDVLLVAVVGLAVLVLSDAQTQGGSGAGPLDTSVTTVIAVAAGLLAARCWPLAARFVAGRGRRGASRLGQLWRLAVLGGQRRALVPAVAAGFLAAATTGVVFAGSYRATLAEAAAEQASFQVPLDARIGASRDVVSPVSVLDAPALQALGAGVSVEPIISSAVTVFGGTQNAAALPLTGVSGTALTGMHDFAATTGATIGAPELAHRLATNVVTGSPAPPVIPADVTTVQIPAIGLSGDIDLILWAATPDGRELQFPLLASGDGARAHLGVDQVLRVVAVEVTESAGHLMHRQHAIGEGNTDHALPAGQIVLGAPKGDGRALNWTWAGWGADNVTVAASPPSLRADYQLNDTRAVVVPAFVPVSALGTLPVAADPITSAQAINGRLTVSVNGLTVPAVVVQTLARMPTVGPRYLIADAAAVTALLDRTQPGTATVDQIWVGAPPALLPALTAVLSVAPVDTANVTFRADIATALTQDPVATRAATLLTAAGVLALLLATIAVGVSVRVDRQDAAADQLSFEVDGLPPRSLRALLVGRAVVVIGLGVPIGAAAGLLVTAAAVRLIQVGATGTAVQPPVQVDLGGGGTVALVAGTVLAGLLAAAAASAGSFRERFPTVPDLDLR